MDQGQELSQAPEEKSERRQYVRPELYVYGDIREITRNLGTTSQKNDGGGGGKTKTA